MAKAKKAVQKTVKKTIKKISKVSISGLEVGDHLPSLKLETTNGTLDLASLKGKKAVFYFYPKDNTPGCTLEGQEFSKLKKDYKKAGYEIFGISRDTVKSHLGFKEKMKFDFELISDPDEEMCQAFGVIKEKNMYGKKVIGVQRSTFAVDEKGKVTHVWRNIKAAGHAAEILKELKA